MKVRPHSTIPLGSTGECASERGFTLIEILVAIVFFGLISVSIASSTIYGMRFQKHAELGNLATNLAVSKIEELSGVDPTTLDAGDNSTETGLVIEGHEITFDRETEITVNADGSRTITVSVSSPSVLLLAPVDYTTRFAPWES